MKENINMENSNLPMGIIKPISIKINKNYIGPFNNFFPDEFTLPEYLSDKEIDSLKEKNKWFFFEYSKLAEENNLLKFKLQELILKKNEFHKYLNKLEHKEKNPNVNSGENINNNISRELINYQNNMFINKKRKRRKKSQIVYKYKCNIKDCNKKYATEGALNQHIKFKHM